MNTTPVTIKITLDYFSSESAVFFSILLENNMSYKLYRHGKNLAIANFDIHIDNYFQYQALGDFLYNRG